ncbi:outer membrane beta-barrel protein [Leptobacterium flavescens]|uniref:Outer membrane beta-barrel protein n=1 Tax=Leptobacterium flavescens TaxID=472055 RepID=A0A6P0UM18_9FLAO|nr:porin family protein [Leptobacterium flavescens]NER13480.1 outer membrane beta-barrel protein [Leptobacterium flavescens]
MRSNKSMLSFAGRTIINSKICLLSGIMLIGTLNAQDKEPQFGLTLGYSLIDINSKSSDIEGDSQPGFFIGAAMNFEFGAKWGLAPQLLYANYIETDFLHIPLYLQLQVDKKLGVLVGPQITILLDDPFDEIHEFGLDIGFGLNYDLSDKIFLNTRYAVELGNRAKDEPDPFFEEDLSFSINSFMFGVGCRF